MTKVWLKASRASLGEGMAAMAAMAAGGQQSGLVALVFLLYLHACAAIPLPSDRWGLSQQAGNGQPNWYRQKLDHFNLTVSQPPTTTHWRLGLLVPPLCGVQ